MAARAHLYAQPLVLMVEWFLQVDGFSRASASLLKGHPMAGAFAVSAIVCLLLVGTECILGFSVAGSLC